MRYPTSSSYQVVFAVVLSLILLAVPNSVAAQSTGCPWCTTPTTCGEVQENANIGGCYNIGNGCQTIPGKCTINETFAAADIAEILHLERFEGLGGQTIDVLGMPVLAFQVEEDLYIQWKCDGSVAAAFAFNGSELITELDPALLQQRYSLHRPAHARS